MISHEYKFIGVHIPKTAGTSIINALEEYMEKIPKKYIPGHVYYRKEHDHSGLYDHASLQEIYLELKKEKFSEYYKFSVVRNPWDRLASWYIHHHHQHPGFIKRNLSPEKFKLFVMSIPNIIENKLDPLQDLRYRDFKRDIDDFIAIFRPQHDWLSVNGEMCMDKIIKVENLNEEFYQLPFVIEINEKIKEENMSGKRQPIDEIKLGHYRKRNVVDKLKDLYDQSMIDIVSDVYKEEIEIFDFRF